MNDNKTRRLIISGLLIIVGLILPMIFHSFGLGNSFLPMHIPVLLAGFILPIPYAAAVGIITPLLSTLLTGMPPIFPVMPYMIFELTAYSVTVSYLYGIRKVNVIFALIGSMLLGRIVAGIAVWLMVQLFEANLPGPFAFIVSAITTGIPGIIVQIIVIPSVVAIMKKINIIKSGALINEN